MKKLKTKSSERIIFMTPPLKEEIQTRLKQIEEDKERLGERYFDYGLLICQPNGRPIEPALSYKKFKNWLVKQEGRYPDIVFTACVIPALLISWSSVKAISSQYKAIPAIKQRGFF